MIRAVKAASVPLMVHLPGWERLAHRVLDVVGEEGVDPRHVVLCHMNPSQHDHDFGQPRGRETIEDVLEDRPAGDRREELPATESRAGAGGEH